MMLALLVTINIYTSLNTISNNLDIAFMNVIKNSPTVARSLKSIEEDIRYTRYQIPIENIEDIEYMATLDLYLLSVEQLQEYVKTGNIIQYKNSISNKIYADALLYTDPLETAKNKSKNNLK